MAPSAHVPFFSLVMPVYNVERYIADSVADILVQTFHDFELIIVDDCSSDCSMNVVQAVAGKDLRVHIIQHEKNQGVSSARNTGIGAAHGKWVLFPDPDDRYEKTLLEYVATAIRTHDTNLVIFAHDQNYYASDGSFLYTNPIDLDAGHWKSSTELGYEALQLEKQTNLGYVWNKAYQLAIIQNSGILFEKDASLIEDFLFNIAYFYQTKAITTIPSIQYHYAKRLSTNLTNEFVPNYHELHRKRISELYSLMESFGAFDENTRATLGALYARFLLSSIEQNSSHLAGMNHQLRVTWLRELFNEPLFNALVPYGRATNSISLAMCLKLLNSHNIPALLALGHAIHLVRTRNTTLYTMIKSHR